MAVFRVLQYVLQFVAHVFFFGILTSLSINCTVC